LVFRGYVYIIPFKINKHEYNDYQFVIWIDLDSNGWEINGIIDSFIRNEEWDVLCGNNNDLYYSKEGHFDKICIHILKIK
jgi:hypothetical protein